MMSEGTKYPCIKCNKEVVSDAIECSICLQWCHRACGKISLKDFKKLNEEDEYWYCFKCCELFPYHSIDVEEFDYLNSVYDLEYSRYELYKKCVSYESEVETFKEYSTCDFENNLDPSNNLYNLNSKCHYYLESQFCAQFSKVKGFAVIHFNCRSIKSSFLEINNFLEENMRKFDIICLTESWLTAQDNLHDYDMEDYEIVNMNRYNKRGGGVMMYISKTIKYKLVKSMSEAIDTLYECVTIEIETAKGKNTLLTCMYRAPGSNIESFLEYLDNLIQQVNNKNFFLVGDFNINLTHYETHSGTKNFMDTLFSYGIRPLINKPTRITVDSSTLIDNIFTNSLDEFDSGIFINDISDHLPIFTVFPKDIHVKISEKTCRFKRLTNAENLKQLKSKLADYNWDLVLNSEDADSAYNDFLSIIKKSITNHVP